MITLTRLCQLTGVSRRTLQGYDEMGLLRHRDTTPGGHWLYDVSDAERLAVIQLLRQYGFTRKEILQILPDPHRPLDEMLEYVRTALLQRRRQLDLLMELLEPVRFRQSCAASGVEDDAAV